MQPVQILKDRFGHERFRGQQHDVIERILEGGHALVIMPTGGGKSLCYQVPAIHLAAAQKGMTVVIIFDIALILDNDWPIIQFWNHKMNTGSV